MDGRYLVAWLLMIPVGILNGVARETTYGRHMPGLRAHQLSTVTGLVLFGLFLWGVDRVAPFRSGGQALGVGLVWVALTIGFEFGFGHYVDRKSWSHLLADYNLRAGRLWLLVLILLGVGPWVLVRLRGGR